MAERTHAAQPQRSAKSAANSKAAPLKKRQTSRSADGERHQSLNPDLALERAKRFGHSISSLRISPDSPRSEEAPAIQLKAAKASLSSNTGTSTGVIQLAKDRPGGNPKGRGGKGRKFRASKRRKKRRAKSQRNQPRKPRSSTKSNPLAGLLNLGTLDFGDSSDSEEASGSEDLDFTDLSDVKDSSGSEEDSDSEQRPKRPMAQVKLKKAVDATGEFFNQPHKQLAKAYLEGLKEPLARIQAPKSAKIKEITPTTNEHGYYSPSEQEISLGVLNPEASRQYEEAGYGTREENLAETGVHEYTHVLDLELAANKNYRRSALRNLSQALPYPAPGQSEVENTNRADRFLQAGGLLDPHARLTLGQGFLTKSHTPILSELMANFAEIASTKDPIAHFMRRPGTTQGANETAEAYQQRITNDYDLLMQNAVVPYATGLSQDNEMPKGVRDFYKHALLTLPTSGEALHQAIRQRQADVFKENEPSLRWMHTHMLAEGGDQDAQQQLPEVKKEALRARLRQKIREKRQQRSKKG